MSNTPRLSVPSKVRTVLLVLIIAGGIGAAVYSKGMGFTARMQGSTAEAWVMRSARSWATPASIRNDPNPVPASAEVVSAAMAHWADHCAVCHANDGSGETSLGRNVYPRAPDMRAARTQGLSDGVLFYVIEQGVPWTAMPAWSNGTDEGARESWALVRFIRHLPTITPDELASMERLNPKSAAQIERDTRIDDFLNGPGGR